MLIVILFNLNNAVMAQMDTTKKLLPADTIKPVLTDTLTSVQSDTTKPSTVAPAAGEEKKAKRKDEFVIYAGANLNQLGTTSSKVEPNGGAGYHAGVYYKRGGFLYWQIGARYNNANFNFVSKSTNSDTSKLSVRAIDLPLTAGINFLSFANRLVSLRGFVSAVPSFTIGVGDNNLGVKKDNVNSFIFYGQVGIGVDIAFVVVELGYNYGFQNMLKDYSNSNPGQAFLSLGFRF